VTDRSFPLFLRLSGRLVLVVGGGPVALEKARSLSAAGARLRVVAPEVNEELATLAESVERRPFEPRDLDSAWLALAAAPSDVNRAVKQAGDERQTFVVAIDDIAHCSAFGAAQLHRGPLTVAISSDGRAPALVSLLRRALEALLVDDVSTWAALAEQARRAWKSEGVPMARRAPMLLSAMNDLYGGPHGH
jgi:siroheme synthase-like protein